jgi:hypothetical protein
MGRWGLAGFGVVGAAGVCSGVEACSVGSVDSAGSVDSVGSASGEVGLVRPGFFFFFLAVEDLAVGDLPVDDLRTEDEAVRREDFVWASAGEPPSNNARDRMREVLRCTGECYPSRGAGTMPR